MRVQFPYGYEVRRDTSDPRQKHYNVYHEGKLIETYDTMAEAAAFIEEWLDDVGEG